MRLALLVGLMIGANGAAATGLPGSAPQTVERGMRFLQKEAFRWKSTGKCAACHHASTVVWTFNEAKARGYVVDEKALTEITEWDFADMKANSLTEEAPPRNVLNLGWVYALLSVETAPALGKSRQQAAEDNFGSTNADPIVSARQTLLEQIVKKQAPDGSWGRPLDERVPLGGPVEDIAILSRLALLQSSDHSRETRDCISRAADWLAAHRDKTSRQARNLRLLMGICEGKPATELAPLVDAIRLEQNSDGGWSQTPEMPSDAYATGQSLYVLARAGLKPDAAVMRRAVEFLTHTQREDGSWPMTSRVHAKNLSPITGAGTQWALLGLIRASP